MICYDYCVMIYYVLTGSIQFHFNAKRKDYESSQMLILFKNFFQIEYVTFNKIKSINVNISKIFKTLGLFSKIY